ncbi:putative ATP-dependent endonuclease of OLD family [Paenibacillus turicensis]|uniref:ATP-dependent endonuclease of OLD family n=1 Tax=Paenibacillus turicensis TaxID=160487 RepID=A0ABS4FR85_9BACL|nr:AAA family ATPase [Paenibacillus turicensis]MBP1905081.1 putative ATP-dependent endonuclease of OLD family [Paenibacillus turicensis]
MELIYLWVQKFRNIKELGFNFSSNFNVTYNRDSKKRELKIMKTRSQSLFNEKISNITAIIGKNGSGKTNLLDLLGEKMEIRRNLGDEEYFIIYHIEDDIYAIEGIRCEIICVVLNG